LLLPAFEFNPHLFFLSRSFFLCFYVFPLSPSSIFSFSQGRSKGLRYCCVFSYCAGHPWRRFLTFFPYTSFPLVLPTVSLFQISFHPPFDTGKTDVTCTTIGRSVFISNTVTNLFSFYALFVSPFSPLNGSPLQSDDPKELFFPLIRRAFHIRCPKPLSFLAESPSSRPHVYRQQGISHLD